MTSVARGWRCNVPCRIAGCEWRSELCLIVNTRVRASFAESEDTRDGEQGVIELLSYCQGKGVPRVEELVLLCERLDGRWGR